MITKQQSDAAYDHFLAEHAQIIEEEDKTMEVIEDFEWGYDRFNQRMIDLYPTAYPVKTFDISSRQLTNMKRGVKK